MLEEPIDIYGNVSQIEDDNSDSLCFTPEQVHATPDTLARTLRSIFVKRGITHSMFTELHRIHTASLGASPKEVNSNRNNLKKAIYRDEVTWRTLEYIIVRILGCRISRIQIDVENEAGESETFELDL